MAPREFALPGTTPVYARDRVCDIQHLALTLDVDVDKRSIEGSCQLRLAAIADELRSIELDAVELDIQAVTRGGEPVRYNHDGHKLRVDLGAPLAAGAQTSIEVAYRAQPRRGLYFIAADDAYPDKPTQVWSQGQDEDSRYWFPCFDSPHEKATSEMRVTVPASWFALSNGHMVSDDTEGDRRTLHWKFEVPHSCYLITLAAGELSELEAEWPENPEVQVRYYVQKGREDDARRALGRTPEMLQLFSERFGVPYPYEKYAQVFVADFIFGGMENTTATTLTDVVLLDERAALDRDVDDLVAHELAHQWFGDLLTCRDWGEGWLNEGFATYSEYLWRQHRDGDDEGALTRMDWADTYFDEDSKRYRRTIATKMYHAPIDVFDAHLYDKGGLVLHMLRRLLGDDAFFASLALYLKRNEFGSVETRDLARAVEAATGKVVDWFFDQWVLRGAGHPELEITYSWDDDTKLACFKVDQTHEVTATTPLFRLPTRLRLRVGDTDVDTAVIVAEKQQQFFVPCAEKPSHAVFDPGHHVLSKRDVHKSDDLWIDQLENATEGIDRIDAAKALANTGGARGHAALTTAMNNDAFWGVRAAAAASLGKRRTAAGRDALIAALKLDHPKARRAVVEALGEFRDDEAAADALAAIVDNGDKSYFVEAEACLSLGKTRSDKAPQRLRSVLDRDAFLDVIRAKAYAGMAAARDNTAVDVLMDGSKYGRVPHGRQAAIGAMATLVRGRTDHDAMRVREHIEQLLRDKNFRVQHAAIQALDTIGDPAAVAALQGVADRSGDARLLRRAREVIRNLSEADRTGKQVGELRDELERLRGEMLTLRARCDELEARLDNPTD